MALSANTVLEVRLTGSDTNGGGFVAGASGTDWSQQNAAQYSVTDGVTNGTTTITSATAAFGTDVVGNLVYVQGGTGAVVAGWYQIISRTNATTIVVDRNTGLTAGTGVTLKIGGALASPGQAAAIATVAGMTTYIKYSASPYIITTTSSNVSGGIISGTAGTAFVGYDTSRAMWVWPVQTNRPTIQFQAGVTAVSIFTNINANYHIQHLILDANSQTGSRCLQMSGILYYVKGMNGVAGGLVQNSNGIAILCEATGCLALPITFFTCLWCVSHDNNLTTPTNFGAFASSGTGSTLYACIAYGNNCDGFGANCFAVNCVAYGNAGAGFNAQNFSGGVYLNCVAEANGTYGYRLNAGTLSLINCADYNNVSGRSSILGGKFWGDILPITGTSSFFVNAAAQDFRLNSNGGGGALLRGAAFPASFPVPANNNFLDVGALQHQDAGGGGSSGIIVNLGMRGGMN